MSQTAPIMIEPSSPPKDPIIAAVLSFFLLGGVGQIYLGQTKKGLILVAGTILLSCVLIGVFIPILGAIDAYQIGTKLKNGQPVREMEWFWEK